MTAARILLAIAVGVSGVGVAYIAALMYYGVLVW